MLVLKFEEAGKKVDKFVNNVKETSKEVKSETQKKVNKGKEKIDLIMLKQRKESAVRRLVEMLLKADRENESMDLKEVLNHLMEQDQFVIQYNKIKELDQKIKSVK